MTADENGFLAALALNPDDVTARGAYADWLEEHDRPYEAALQRGAAGLSEVYYKIRRRSDGLFSEGPVGRGKPRWSPKGKLWRSWRELMGHLHARQYRQDYDKGAPFSDLEVLLVEVRLAVIAAMPVEVRKLPPHGRTSLVVTEPLGGPGKANQQSGRK